MAIDKKDDTTKPDAKACCPHTVWSHQHIRAQEFGKCTVPNCSCDGYKAA